MYDLEFLPTPSARRATAPLLVIPDAERISTHALREEGDLFLPQQHPYLIGISTHALREEGDCTTSKFTLSRLRISTHALREEGDVQAQEAGIILRISTHALREEGDWPSPGTGRWGCNFYPRPPRGGRPSIPAGSSSRDPFLPTPSARRATSLSAYRQEAKTDFYPRPPRGGRRPEEATRQW